MNECGGHYTKRNKPITKEQILCDFTNRRVVASSWEAIGMGNYHLMGTEFQFCKIKIILDMGGSDGEYIKCH